MAGNPMQTVDADLYQEDFHLWTQRQAQLLRQRRFTDVDLEHLIEEIEDLGSSQRSTVESHVINVLWHLLKLQFSPAVPPRHGWEITVEAQRIGLKRRLTASLRNHVAAELQQLYVDARRLAVRDLRQDSVPADRLPLDCPYTVDQILDLDWSPRTSTASRTVEPLSGKEAVVATRTRKTASPPLYDEDFYIWAQRQGDLLRERRFAELDLTNLIEEVDDLARREWKAVRSHARRVIEHLLKLQFSPAASPRGGWLNTVITQRAELEDGLTPSLRRDLAAALGDLYRRARDAAAADMRQDRVALEQLPETCPYTIDQILDFGWLPANVHGVADD